MRIAYLTSQYPAASHTFIRREVAALRRAGLDVVTFSVRRPGADEISSGADRISFGETQYILPSSLLALIVAHCWALARGPVTYLRTFALAMHHRPPGARAASWALFHFVEAIVLARQLKLAKVSRLHNHFANSGATVGLLAARVLGLPWSLTLHGISETDYPAGILLPEKLRVAEFAACVSWFGRAQAMRITPPALWDRLILVRCGIESTKLLPSPPRSGARDRCRIVCIGRLSAEKGQAGLIDVYAKLLADGLQVELVMVGDGPERTALVERADREGVGHSVEFLGRLPEKETLAVIANADLLVLPSFMEGLPVVLMEAMALGVPVIASQVAGIPELVIHEQTGLLFPASNWGALDAAMRRLLADEALRTGLVAAARRKVLAEFDIDSAIEPLVAHFLATCAKDS